jgi:glycosyltransferase involved in cell wall biosynthesis
MLQIQINGKFTAQRTTGVQRFAWNLVQALDRELSARPACAGHWQLLCPPEGLAPALRHIQVRHVGTTGLPLHLWEQAVLPWVARDGLLISLAGSAPLWATRQWCTFHDAAVFDHPGAYRPAFVVWYRNHFRWLARHAERVLTVSAHSQARLADCLDLQVQDITVVPNGGDHLLCVQADDSIVATLGLEPRRYLLAVGSQNPTKNLPALLQAWDQIRRDRDLKLVLVGGADAAVFADTGPADGAARSGVVRAGVVGDGALKSLYSHALGLVFPSLDEGFGLPPLEALSLSCPVAAARAGAIPEVCGDAVLYFDPRSVADMGVALSRLIEDAALRTRLAAAGPPQAARWPWRRSATTLLGLLAPLTVGGA